MHKMKSLSVSLSLGFMIAACAVAQERSDTGVVSMGEELMAAPPIPPDAQSIAIPAEALRVILPGTQSIASASITWFQSLLRNGVSVDSEEEARRFHYLYGLNESEAFEFKSMISNFMTEVHEQDADSRARACRGFQDAVREQGEAAVVAGMFDLFNGAERLEEPYQALIEALNARFGRELTTKLDADIANSANNKEAYGIDLRKYVAALGIDAREHIEKTICPNYL